MCLIYPTFHISLSYCQIHDNLSFQHIYIYQTAPYKQSTTRDQLLIGVSEFSFSFTGFNNKVSCIHTFLKPISSMWNTHSLVQHLKPVLRNSLCHECLHNIYIYIYIYIYACVCVCIYIYIYIWRSFNI